MQIDQNIDGTVQQLVDRARCLLNADSVVFFSQQDPTFIASGEPGHFDSDGYAAFVQEIRLRDSIYEKGAVYLENEDQYREFIAAQEANLDHATGRDFWTRQDIKSSAFVRIGRENDPAAID